MGDEVTTGGGANVSGDVGTGGGDFTGRDKREFDININVGPNRPTEPPSEPRGRTLLPNVEKEFRDNFSKITEALVKLEGALLVSNEITKLNIAAIKEQIAQTILIADTTRDMMLKGLSGINVVVPAKPPPPWIWPVFTVFGVLFLVLLSVIAFYLATGGH